MTGVIVTGVGGGVGQSVLKALQGSPYRVVGVDAEELAAGLHACPVARKGRYAADPLFVDALLEIARQEDARLVFPGHDVELLPLAAQAARLREAGVIPVVSPLEVVRLCDDKLATRDFVRGLGLPTPATWPLAEVDAFPGPVVLKPQRGGARSKRTYVARTAAEFDLFRRLVDPANCVVQEYIEGDEYTCGSVTLDGRCAGVIVMRRTLRDGDTYKAFVERQPAIEAAVRRVVEGLQPFGACNVQLRLRGGEPYVFEINARCSGTTASRALAGFNEPRMIADYLLQGLPPAHAVRELSILRYWKELVVPNDRIAELGRAGRLDGNGQGL